MALKACKECGHQVSTEAKSCPQCGAKAPPGKRMGVLGMVFVGVMSFGILGAFMGSRDGSSKSPAVPAIKTQEQVEKGKDEARFSFAFDSAVAIKKAMRDPDSLKWEYIGVNDDASVACIKYRAKNGFGGMNAEIAVVVKNEITQKAADWDKNCAKGLRNYTAAG